MTALLPFKDYVIHCVGIGGIGMSGIAELLHDMGCTVRGSDISDNANVHRLRARGIDIAIGHDAAHLSEASVVVYSSAIGSDNVELQGARERRIPIISRATMLAELMHFKRAIAVAGSHGKTTTTSLLAHVLEHAQLSPTVVNGGVIEEWGSNVRLGTGDFLLAETDESDGSFVHYHPEFAVVTNIDAEHINHYGDFAALRRAFDEFIATIPFYGCAILNMDSHNVQEMRARMGDGRRVITYGFAAHADVRAINAKKKGLGWQCDVVLRDGVVQSCDSFAITLPMVGRHNLSNALAAIATALCMGVDIAAIQKGIASFGGVHRRFQIMGVTSRGVVVINDYAHHPTEIHATLEAAREHYGKRSLIAVHQPHRYSRLRDVFNQFLAAFNDADGIIIADVYEAGERPIAGYDADHLAGGLRAAGHPTVMRLKQPHQLASMIHDMAGDDAIVVCMGAGSIGGWSKELFHRLSEGHESQRKIS